LLTRTGDNSSCHAYCGDKSILLALRPSVACVTQQNPLQPNLWRLSAPTAVMPLPCYFGNDLLPLPRRTHLPLYFSEFNCISRAATPSIRKSNSASQHLTSFTTHFFNNASCSCDSHFMVPSSINAPEHSIPRLTSVASSSSPLSPGRNPTGTPLHFAHTHRNIVDSLRLPPFLILLPFPTTTFRVTPQINTRLKNACPNSLRQHK